MDGSCITPSAAVSLPRSAPPNEISFSPKKTIWSHSLFFLSPFFFKPSSDCHNWKHLRRLVHCFQIQLGPASWGGGLPHTAGLPCPREAGLCGGALSVMTMTLAGAGIS